VIIKLRQKKQSIGIIAKFLGRSTSFVFKTINFNHKMRFLKPFDLRNIPARIRKLSAKKQLFIMRKLWQGWEKYLLGEVDKPP